MICCSNALVRTSSIILNRSGKGNIFCPVPDLRKLSIFYDWVGCKLCAFHIYGLYCAEVAFPYWFVESFFFPQNRAESCQPLFLSMEMIMWFLCFILLIWFITSIDFCMFDHLCVPRINPIWTHCVFFNVLLNSLFYLNANMYQYGISLKRIFQGKVLSIAWILTNCCDGLWDISA